MVTLREKGLNLKTTTVLETDTSWLSKNQTLEEARRTMQKSISMVTYPANIPYIWVADLESNSIRSQQSGNILEDGAKTPHCRPQRKRRGSTKPSDFLRLRNSFLHYRNLVQQCFSDDTTQPILSKRIAELWAAETPEMRFFCERNAAIESHLGTVEGVPPLDVSFSAHPIVRALGSRHSAPIPYSKDDSEDSELQSWSYPSNDCNDKTADDRTSFGISTPLTVEMFSKTTFSEHIDSLPPPSTPWMDDTDPLFSMFYPWTECDIF